MNKIYEQEIKRKSKSLMWSKVLLAISIVNFTGLLTYIVLSNLNTDQNEVTKQKYFAKTYSPPNKLYFAGEQIPLHDPDILERYEREMYINTYWQSNTILLIKRCGKWLPVLSKILKEQGIPDDLKYIAIAESGLMNVRSPKSAVGFWQLLSGTAQDFGLEVRKQVDERYDPYKSTLAACKYLNKAHKKFGNWTLAAASYNMGIAGIDQEIQQQGVKNYYELLLNEETARYIFRIIALKEIITAPGKFGLKINENHLYQREKFTTMKIKDDILDLPKFAREQGVNYKILKRFNPWLRKSKLNIPNGYEYELHFPLKIKKYYKN